MQLYRSYFYNDDVDQIVSAESFTATMVRVEVALAKAQTACGIIPEQIAYKLEKIAAGFNPDLAALQRSIPLAGNAAAPLVKQLTAAVAEQDAEAAKHLHLGATSQDVADTAIVLQWQAFFAWLETELNAISLLLRQSSKKYRATPMIGRTLMQQARPITFGLKVAYWLQALQQLQQMNPIILEQCLRIQLAGAVGSGNQFLTKEVRQACAKMLGLQDGPGWHTNRLPVGILAAHLGTMAGWLRKIAEDVILMAQTEVGELAEPKATGRGTSSTMPQKRNPVLCTAIVANTQQVPFLVSGILAAMAQPHERAAGTWQAEWESMDRLLQLIGGAVEKTKELLTGLEVNEDRMRQNIEHTQGLVYAESVAFALAKKLGKAASHDLIKTACQRAQAENRHLLDVLANMDLPIDATTLKNCFQPENTIGNSLDIIDEILANV